MSAEPERLPVEWPRPRPAKATLAGPLTLPDYLPARMLNEFVYCPRLFFYEWVEGLFAHNADTIEAASGRWTGSKGQKSPLTNVSGPIEAALIEGRTRGGRTQPRSLIPVTPARAPSCGAIVLSIPDSRAGASSKRQHRTDEFTEDLRKGRGPRPRRCAMAAD